MKDAIINVIKVLTVGAIIAVIGVGIMAFIFKDL